MSPEAYSEMAQMQTMHWWFVARRKILRSQIDRLNLPAGADILEIGSGTGANLDLLADFGKVVALEMSADAIVLAKERCSGTGRQISMRQGRCPEDLAGLAQKFDLICLFDVLEHIEQDGASLAGLGSMLKPGGKLLLTVPAYQWMWGPHDTHLHHHRRYSKHLLSARCAEAGLSIARVSHFNTLLFPLAVMGRLFEKLRGTNTLGTQAPPTPVNALLAFTFALERHLLARVSLPFGLSLLLLAQPRQNA